MSAEGMDKPRSNWCHLTLDTGDNILQLSTKVSLTEGSKKLISICKHLFLHRICFSEFSCVGGGLFFECFLVCLYCFCRLHCCWQLKHLLRGYEHIVKQVNSTLRTQSSHILLHNHFCCLTEIQLVCCVFYIFCHVIRADFFFLCSAWHYSCALCQPSGSPHSREEKKYFSLFN